MPQRTASRPASDPIIDRFAEALWLEDGLAPLTLAAYRRDLSLFHGWLQAQGGPPLVGVNEGDLQAYFADRHALTRATTANRRLTVFRRFYHWLLREQKIQADPTARILSARQPLRVPKGMSEVEVEALLSAPDVESVLGQRDRAMLELMYASGLRVSELVNLKVFHISLNEGVLRVMGKGSKERLVPFGQVAAQWLEQYMNQSRPAILGQLQSEDLFITVQIGRAHV